MFNNFDNISDTYQLLETIKHTKAGDRIVIHTNAKYGATGIDFNIGQYNFLNVGSIVIYNGDPKSPILLE